MQYVIKYEYYSWEESCGCCSDSESSVEIFHNRLDAYMSSFSVPIMEDEEELREYIDKYHPEYSNFIVHEDTRWY
jgi:hypothetical protein